MTNENPRQIEALAALIREVDSSHDLGAAALAEALVGRGVRVVKPREPQMWGPVKLNESYSRPIFGLKFGHLGRYLRKEPTAENPKGELVAFDDRGQAQQKAVELNADELGLVVRTRAGSSIASNAERTAVQQKCCEWVRSTPRESANIQLRQEGFEISE